MAGTIDRDFELRHGAKNVIRITVKNAAGTVVDISGASAIVWSLARTRRSVENEIQKDLDDGIAFEDDGSDGVFLVTVAAADIAELRGDYFHDAAVTLNSTPQIVAEGTVTIRESLSL